MMIKLLKITDASQKQLVYTGIYIDFQIGLLKLDRDIKSITRSALDPICLLLLAIRFINRPGAILGMSLSI